MHKGGWDGAGTCERYVKCIVPSDTYITSVTYTFVSGNPLLSLLCVIHSTRQPYLGQHRLKSHFILLKFHLSLASSDQRIYQWQSRLQFEIQSQKPFPNSNIDYSPPCSKRECGLLALLFWIGRVRNVPRFLTHVHREFFAADLIRRSQVSGHRLQVTVPKSRSHRDANFWQIIENLDPILKRMVLRSINVALSNALYHTITPR